MTDTRRRVKLYALNADRQWDDKGTGHVSSNYVERLKGISLLVRAESDGKIFCMNENDKFLISDIFQVVSKATSQSNC